MDFRSMLNPSSDPTQSTSRMSFSSLLHDSSASPPADALVLAGGAPLPLAPESDLMDSFRLLGQPSHSFSHLLSTDSPADTPSFAPEDSPDASVVPDSDVDASVVVPDSDVEDELPLAREEVKREWADGDETVRDSAEPEKEGSPDLVSMDVDDEVDIMSHDSAREVDEESKTLKLNPLTKQPKRAPSKKSSKSRRSTLSRAPSPTASTSHSPPSHSPSPAPTLPYLFNFPPPPQPLIEKEIVRPEWLSRPFSEYEPPGGNESDGEDEATRAAARRRKGARRDREKEREEEEEEEKDDRLYCVCRQLYDPDRTMIACDKCEEWYHLDCIKIDDDNIDLVDTLICPFCEKLSPARTTWHPPCARPSCLRAVMPLSKYCSDYCGISVAATRLSLSCATTGLHPEAFWSAVVGARRLEAAVVDSTIPAADLRDEAIRRAEEADERTMRSLQDKLGDIVARRQVLEANRYLIHARLRYLRVAIRRWEALCQATADGLASELGVQPVAAKGKKKKKSGGGATSLPDAQCGFDVRLVYDEREWEGWLEGDEGRIVLGREDDGDEGEAGLEMMDHVCLRPRKKCERHTGWQKVRQADFEVEQAVLTRRLGNLDIQERRIRTRMEDHDEAARFRLLHRNRTGHAIDVEGEMQTEKTPPKRARQALIGPAHLQPTQTVNAVPNGGEQYDVPDEVFKFLSRGEQAKLKAQRR